MGLLEVIIKCLPAQKNEGKEGLTSQLGYSRRIPAPLLSPFSHPHSYYY